jgi:hypothetical protein
MTVGRRSFSEGAKRGSSIPETAVIEPKSRGVLDRPVKPDDDSSFDCRPGVHRDDALGSASLARPHNPRDPFDVAGREGAVGLIRIERLQFQRLCGAAF